MHDDHTPDDTNGLSPVLKARHVSKTFDATVALDQFAIDILPGEVHGLIGQNGSGKSTFIKLLAGFHEPDPGAEITVAGGEPVSHLEASEDYGIAFVHQDLGLIPSLTVLENMCMESLSHGKYAFVSWKRERARVKEALQKLDVDVSLDARIDEIAPVDQALLAIARATSGRTLKPGAAETRLLVLDEPTVFLPATSVRRLFDTVRHLASSGAAVLFVSHDMDEVLTLTDRITVLRDARVVAEVTTAEIKRRELVQAMVGRDVQTLTRRTTDRPAEDAVVSVEGLSGSTLQDASFSVRPSEILGLAGLAGSGADEIAELLMGVRPAEAGTLTIGGRSYDLSRIRPHETVAAGMRLVPADRARNGGIGSLSVAENLAMAVLDSYTRFGRVANKRLNRDVARVVEQFQVTPSDTNIEFRHLSGGNQQKVILAKWLQTRPKVLMLDHPTQGVDIGARLEIFQILRRVSVDGMAVICMSTDLEELEMICDRIIVFSRGLAVDTLTGPEITSSRLAESALGGDRE